MVMIKGIVSRLASKLGEFVVTALRRFVGLVFGAAMICAAPGLASASVPNQTYNFSGVCSDCFGGTGTAHAELVLQGGYTRGSAFDASDVVSFHYDGTDLLPAFTLTSSSPDLYAAGLIPSTLPAAAQVFIQADGALFTSGSDGYWCAGQGCLLDNGGGGVWSARVPEPGVWAMLTVGVAGLGATMRRRRLMAAA